ncbi:Oidioi.mRNA.OKI2018_I69.PAR.g11580.t1.cds [Oikopleura dioica]|uniref:Oidioi.mRNA.OKI2018_I69.PAR.g11580.t1.cds n=1 Tax=Oikopleura dioica TaxID=34765 RepID=A0ABN7RZQ8_OIKDI|nr:Oidioi.mRNA.OKI2018_I69.PAR.g11580.t1.cds [Oikopleura dioica]
MEFELDGKTESVTVDSGVGKEIVKEELRGDIVGNLFYPAKGGKFPVIIHINGGINHIQDARSSLLAREGYLVLELAYNVQDYGQPVLFTRDGMPLEYVEQAIKTILSHQKAYGDRVVLMGQSQAGSTQLPVASELTYKGQRWQKMDEYMQIDDLAELGKYFNLPEEFGQAFSPKYGTFVVLRGPGGFLWKEKEGNEGEFELNYEAAKSIKERRFPLENLNKLHFFSTLDDRTITPSFDLAIELMEYFLGDLPNCHVEHFHSGHLAVLPEIPVVHCSNMSLGQLKCGLIWSSNESEEEKLKEANEYRSIHRRVKEILRENL